MVTPRGTPKNGLARTHLAKTPSVTAAGFFEAQGSVTRPAAFLFEKFVAPIIIEGHARVAKSADATA